MSVHCCWVLSQPQKIRVVAMSPSSPCRHACQLASWVAVAFIVWFTWAFTGKLLTKMLANGLPNVKMNRRNNY